MSTKRSHHHTPSSYLAGFTPEWSKDGTLSVLQLETGREWQSTPVKSARARDYYRMEGNEPNAFEDALMGIESDAMPVINEIDQTRKVPVGSKLNSLLAFIASMAARTPPRRKHWNKTERQLFGLMQDVYAAHPEALVQLREDTAREHEADPHDDAVEFLQHIENPDAEFSSSWSVKRLLMEMEPVRFFLERMTWSLVVPPDDCGPLIASDHVGVLFNPPRGSRWLPPAFGDKDSEYTFPLNQHLLLLGRYGGESDLYQMSREGVATFNRRAFWYASELYFPPGDFLWLSPEGAILDRVALVRRVAAKPTRDDRMP